MTRAQQARPMSATAKKEQEEARVKLREWLQPGMTVYTILRHVSRSGMSRDVGVVLMWPDGSTLNPNHLVAKATGGRVNKAGDGVVMGGCGMDMGFALVNDLSYNLFPDGFDCIGDKCPAADHFNNVTAPASGVWHHDSHQGAYALRQRWL